MSLVYECVMLEIPREELESRFAKEFSEARIVLLGSTRLGEKRVWAYGMVSKGLRLFETFGDSSTLLPLGDRRARQGRD
jgi:hypothetical protein